MEARSRLFRRTDVAITPYCTRHSGGSQSPVKAGRSPAPPCRGVRDPPGSARGLRNEGRIGGSALLPPSGRLRESAGTN